MKQLYQRFSLREKLFFTSFLWLVAFLWLLVLIKGTSALKQEHALIQKALQYQQVWFGKESSVKKRLEAVLKRVNSEKTYDRTRFVGKIEELARTAGLRFTSETPQTNEGDIFDAHSLRISVSNASLGDLLYFNQLILQEAPYLGLESARVSANVRFPNRLNANFHLAALQLKKLSNL